MSKKSVLLGSCDDVGSGFLKKAQRTSLETAWAAISCDKIDHARNIFAKFVERYPSRLSQIYDMDMQEVQENIKKIVESFEMLIEKGLNDPEAFKFEILGISQEYMEYIDDLHQISKISHAYLKTQLADYMTRTLEDALHEFFQKIESTFPLKFSEEKS